MDIQGSDPSTCWSFDLCRHRSSAVISQIHSL